MPAYLPLKIVDVFPLELLVCAIDGAVLKLTAVKLKH